MTALSHRKRAVRTPAFVLIAGVTALTTGIIGFAPGVANASSHREAPLIAGDPKADNTDVYAYVAKDAPDSVTLIANWNPFEEPNGGPNFYPFATDAHYNINIDNTGDGKADVIYRWTFKTQDKRSGNTFLYDNGPVTSLNDANLLFRQTYNLEVIRKGAWHRAHGTHKAYYGPYTVRTLAHNVPAAPSFTGKASMPDYGSLRSEAVKHVYGGGKTFAGQADDSFFLDLRVFDLLYGGNLSEAGHDTLSGYNVNTIALQVPKSAVALHGSTDRNPVIGVWSTTDRQSVLLGNGKASPFGKFHQVSRLGNPLVNEVVVPTGLKDAFNSLSPATDHTVAPVVNRVLDPEVPKLIQSIYGIPAPPTPRKDLAEIFLTGISKNSGGPIQADLNSQLLNKDIAKSKFVPSEELRLNLNVPPTASPNRLGVLANDLQGFPNGRRLTDDVVDIELQALEGAAQTGTLVPALAGGDGVNTNDNAFGSTFPYVALPNMGSVNAGGANAAVLPPVGGGGGSRTPMLPAASALAALALLGAGAVLAIRRRPSTPVAVAAR